MGCCLYCREIQRLRRVTLLRVGVTLATVVMATIGPVWSQYCILYLNVGVLIAVIYYVSFITAILKISMASSCYLGNMCITEFSYLLIKVVAVPSKSHVVHTWGQFYWHAYCILTAEETPWIKRHVMYCMDCSYINEVLPPNSSSWNPKLHHMQTNQFCFSFMFRLVVNYFVSFSFNY